MRLVIVESPFAGDVATNRAYAIRALRDSLYRGEAPFASHLAYTEALSDDNPDERRMGIEAGLAVGQHADLTAVYTDLGFSHGMLLGIDRARSEGRPIVFRRIPDAGRLRAANIVRHRDLSEHARERLWAGVGRETWGLLLAGPWNDLPVNISAARG